MECFEGFLILLAKVKEFYVLKIHCGDDNMSIPIFFTAEIAKIFRKDSQRFFIRDFKGSQRFFRRDALQCV